MQGITKYSATKLLYIAVFNNMTGSVCFNTGRGHFHSDHL